MSGFRMIVLDTETSGLTPPIGVCECGFVELNPDTLAEIGRSYSLIDPEVPISPSASGVHRITNSMVAEEPTLDEWFVQVLNDPFKDQNVLMVAHNAPFDHPLVEKHLGNSRTLCTLKLARHAYPDAENHKLATLKYMFNLGSGGHSHSAMADVEDTADLLRKIASDLNMTLDQLMELQDTPRLLTVMPFGMHKGVEFQSVPSSYWKWLKKQDKVDPDVLHTLKHLSLL